MYEVEEGRTEDPPNAVHVVTLFESGVMWEPLVSGRWPWHAALATSAVVRHVVIIWEAEYQPAKERTLQLKLGSKILRYEAFIVQYDRKEAKFCYKIEDDYRMMTLYDADVKE